MASALILLWLALLAAGETPTGRSMRRVMIDRPAAWLGRFTRGQVLLLGASLLFGALLFLLMEEEGLRLFGMYAPELMGMLASLELTSMIDMLAVAVSTTAMVRIRSALGWVRAKLPQRRARAVRQRRRRVQAAANDEDGPAPALARAA